jgi:REP element-mobilizing transposase RayT
MARAKRIWYKGAVYHVMSRGIRRMKIFSDDADYIYFLECIDKFQKIYDFKVHTICLMTNHFHMIIETGEKPISKIMQDLLLAYAKYFNRKYSYHGHLFEGRFVSKMIEDEVYFLESSRYIHLNPVKAGMVREILDYKYGSYAAFVSAPDREENVVHSKAEDLMTRITTTSRILDLFRKNSREEYRIFVEGRLSHAEQEMMIQKDLHEDDKWLPWEKKKLIS